METSRPEMPVRTLARIGGLLYLIIIVIGAYGEMGVRGKIVVSGDAEKTVANLRSMESLWRWGIAGEYTLLICAAVLTMIFYVLLKPVSRRLALASAFVNLVSIAIEAAATMGLVAALFPLGKGAYLGAFTSGQLGALTMMAIRWHNFGFGVALLFFGVVCLMLGVLIYRSGYIARAIGILMQIAGVCYLIDSLALLVAPAIADAMFPFILVPCLIGEASFCVWLLVKGVNEEKWKLRSAAAGLLP